VKLGICNVSEREQAYIVSQGSRILTFMNMSIHGKHGKPEPSITDIGVWLEDGKDTA
jgi:hypothetical protein